MSDSTAFLLFSFSFYCYTEKIDIYCQFAQSNLIYFTIYIFATLGLLGDMCELKRTTAEIHITTPYINCFRSTSLPYVYENYLI